MDLEDLTDDELRVLHEQFQKLQQRAAEGGDDDCHPVPRVLVRAADNLPPRL